MQGEVLTSKPQESLLANMQERLIQTDQGTLVLSQTQQQQKQQQQNTITNAGITGKKLNLFVKFKGITNGPKRIANTS